MMHLAQFTSRTSRMVPPRGRVLADACRHLHSELIRRPPVAVPPIAAATIRPGARSKSPSTPSSSPSFAASRPGAGARSIKSISIAPLSFLGSSKAPRLRSRACAVARMRYFSRSSHEIYRRAVRPTTGGATRSFVAQDSGDGMEGGGRVRAGGVDGREGRGRGEKNQSQGRRSRRRKRVVGRYDDHHNRNDAGDGGGGLASSGGLQSQSLGAAPFRPMREDGEEFDSFDEYIESVPLSPWVPTPDAVARRMLQLADAGPDDVHFDLGSGDGRLNLAAIDRPFRVRRSVGVDVDANLIRASNDRLAAIHPRPTNVEFICADLLDTSSLDGLGLEECTVLTMYFVEEGLRKLRPVIEGRLGGTGCRVVTNGYPMEGWEADWVEAVLGLSIHLYVMR